MLKFVRAAILALFALSSGVVHAACCSTFSILSDTTRQWSSSVLLPPTYTDALVLTANVSATQAVPKNAAGASATWVVFSANCNFFALPGATAAVPGSTTTDGSASMQNPAAWNISNSVTQITVIAPTACVVTLSFYQ
jgi:hypothetical protein